MVCAWVTAGAFAFMGCHGCRDDHPYVPYSIDSEAFGDVHGDASATAGDASFDASAERYAPRAAAIAPTGLSKWTFDGFTLGAPPGETFVSGVVTEGKEGAFAIVRRTSGDGSQELAYYRASDREGALDPVAVLPPPELAPPEQDCVPVARLTTVGPRAVLVDLGSHCPHLGGAIGARRWVAIVASDGAKPVVRLAVTLASDAPELRVDGQAVDLDGDGVADVSLRVTLDDAPSASSRSASAVGASVTWLDRPAGLSQNISATEASFSSLAAAALSRAGRPKEVSSVLGSVAQARLLYRAICAEAGAPRMTAVTGAGSIACGGARALEELGLAEVRAFATMGDGLRAALALERAGRSPAARTPSRVAEATSWITKASPTVLPRFVRAIAAVPNVPPGRGPSWGPLAFLPSGKLLVSTKAGVAIMTPETGDEAAAEDIAAWSFVVSSPDLVVRWTDVVDPCDGSGLHARFTSGPHDEAGDVLLPVSSPLGFACSLGRRPDVRLLPVAWDASGIEAFVDGTAVHVQTNLSGATPIASFTEAPSRRGGPRSPDGGSLVVSTSSGLVVRSGGKDRLFRASELDGTYDQQQVCTVSNDANHVACVLNGKAWVGAWQ